VVLETLSWYVRLGYTGGIVVRFGAMRGLVFRDFVVVGELCGLNTTGCI